MEKVPKKWPKEVQYITKYVFDESVNQDIRKLYSSKKQVANKPDSHYTKIQIIEDTSHPAKGQCGLFAAKTIPPGKEYIYN